MIIDEPAHQTIDQGTSPIDNMNNTDLSFQKSQDLKASEVSGEHILVPKSNLNYGPDTIGVSRNS
jgi:hypothetical protein